MPWYLYIALRHLFPQGRRWPFFTTVSVIGVTLGVMLLVVVISVFSGFGHEIRKVVAETSGDLKIMNGRIFYDQEERMALLEKDPRVLATAPAAFGFVVLQRNNRPTHTAVQGIDVERELAIVPMGKYLISGSVDDLDDDSILVSTGIANTLGLLVGDEVEVYTPLMLERMKRDEILLPRLVRVAGVFRTGFNRIDESTILTTLRSMQDLYGLGDGVHAIKVKLAPGFDMEETAADLQQLFKPPFRVSSWLESNGDFLAIIEFEKRMMFFLLLFIIIVGSFSIATSLFTTVVRKTREIGLFASMGASRRQIAACFCFQGFAVGVCGTILGFCVGFGVLAMRDSITDVIVWLIGGEESALEFYFFSTLPVHVKLSDHLVIGVFSILIATLAGVIPAYKASRMKPVEALRSE